MNMGESMGAQQRAPKFLFYHLHCLSPAVWSICPVPVAALERKCIKEGQPADPTDGGRDGGCFEPSWAVVLKITWKTSLLYSPGLPGMFQISGIHAYSKASSCDYCFPLLSLKHLRRTEISLQCLFHSVWYLFTGVTRI